MNSIFSAAFLKAATWLFRQSLGTKKGDDALAHAAPILVTLSDAAGQAGAVAVQKAAASNGNLAAISAIVNASNQP